MSNDFFIPEDEIDYNIDFQEIKVKPTITMKKNASPIDSHFLNALKEEYVTSLKEKYDVDSKLFNHMEELLEEAEDQEKLMQILDSL